METKTAPTPIGEETLFTITNASGGKLMLSTLDASIVSIIVPDSNGNYADIVNKQGFALQKNNITANVISRKQIWQANPEGNSSVYFTDCQGKGNSEFSERFERKITYVWRADNTLEIYLEASPDAPTISALSRVCFNLDGEGSDSLLDHTLWLNASKYLSPRLNAGIPKSVKDTPFDFSIAKCLGVDFLKEIKKNVQNIYWLINGWEEGVMQEAAVLASHKSGRQLSIYTTNPILQVDLTDNLNGISISCHDWRNSCYNRAIPNHPTDAVQQMIFIEITTMT